MPSTSDQYSRRRVKFNPELAFPASSCKIQKTTSRTYSGIVFYFLSKLRSLIPIPYKSFFQSSTADVHLKSILKNAPKPSVKATSSETAYDVVNAAIQYGCNNNVIERVGHYFFLKEKNAAPRRWMQKRAPTPGPHYVRCTSCDGLSKRRNHKRKKDRHHRKRHARNESDGDNKEPLSCGHSYCRHMYSKSGNNKTKWSCD